MSSNRVACGFPVLAITGSGAEVRTRFSDSQSPLLIGSLKSEAKEFKRRTDLDGRTE
jgi:hypothetical protein